MTKSNFPEKLAQIQRIRDSVPLPGSIAELYDERGKLLPQYMEHRPAQRAIQRYHTKAGEAVRQNGQPPGLQQAMHLPLLWVQSVNRYPWAVMWIRVVDGRRVKGRKLCATLGHAILVQRQVAKRVPNATIVSRARGYDIPPELRGKLPPRWYWCPRCMKPRKYQRDENDETFYTIKKTWSNDKQRYIPKERKLYVLRCPMCACTNRDPAFRRSNQPWELRVIKRGVTRVKRKGR